MILKETLREVAKSQKEEMNSQEYGVERTKLDAIDIRLPFATILAGIRRCGKSTLLHQLMKKKKRSHYFNFEDTRIAGFKASDFQKLKEVLEEQDGECEYYFFDEVQNIPNWERFVRTMLDKKKKFVITGSNASLLSKELGTKLTGRHLTYELFPFSFEEVLNFYKKKPSVRSFEKYLEMGGFPEYLKYKKTEILQELFNDIIMRDIVVKHKLRDSGTVKKMALYLISNVGKEFSYNKLKSIFELGSINTAISFVSYFEDSYLIFIVPKFDYSLKKQLINPKKVYSIDNGLSNSNSASFSSDRGRMLENSVFLHLRRKYDEIFYFKEKKECDFVVKEKNKVVMAVQVCYNLHEDNQEREVGGLVEALEKFNLEEGLILTFDQEDELKVENKKIILKPAWKWMLEK